MAAGGPRDGDAHEDGGAQAESVTQLLGRMAADPPPDGKLSLNALLERAGRRGPAFLMLFLTLLSMIFSVVPGVSTVLALPLLLLSWQILLGRRKLSLPGWVGRRSLDHMVLAQGLHARLHYVQRVERFLRPRLTFLCAGPSLRLVGLASLFCTLVLAAPLPGLNFPPTLAVFLMALGLLGQDGLLVLAGFVVALLVALTLVALAIFVPEALNQLWQLLGFSG